MCLFITSIHLLLEVKYYSFTFIFQYKSLYQNKSGHSASPKSSVNGAGRGVLSTAVHQSLKLHRAADSWYDFIYQTFPYIIRLKTKFLPVHI